MRGAGFIAVTLFISGSALAQQIDGATDNELFAAYCVGALHSDHPTSSEEAKIQAFRAYLIARGATSRSRFATQGLNIAVEQGLAQGKACNQLRESCVTRCITDAKGSIEEARDCNVSCDAYKCEKPDRCLSITQIPF
jgi:hypothetical protein